MAELNVQVSKLDSIPDQINVIDSKKTVTVKKTSGHRVFTPEAGLDNKKYRYMVRLVESPVALYQGGIEGFKATSPEATQSTNRKLDVKSKDVISYRNFLESRQNDVLAKIETAVSGLDVKQRTNLAFNGMVIEMTQDQAMKVANVAGIAHIKRETLRYTQTDSGPAFIKAPGVWDGTASGTASQGEGMVVGIIDTGINTDNPSFADVGGDGYDHTNPWGAGTYSGDCATEEWAGLCNDKLIGVHSWPVITDQYPDYDADVPANGEDHNGHGSHTAGTTAGNVLLNTNVPNVDGGDTGVAFESMSGVAPHANIISYQVCLPGEDDAINFRGCYPSLTVLAVEHAIEAGVDAINYSIGGGSSDPWQDADALSFLSARKAGIHVATSAGNSGPGPETVGSPGDAPWITTVAAYSHDRGFSDKTIDGFTGGDTEAPSAMTGKAITGEFSGPIVYAGDYANPNDPDGDPAQCLQPFPAETFPAGAIVVCDRGAIARVDKGRNAAAGGAAALVLANIDGGATSVAADAHMIPAIHINAEDGNALRTWLASGEGHMANISGTEVMHDEALGNIAADFTSRGPNASVPDVIVPSIAAPGLSIFAAYADDQSAGFKEFPDPVDYAFLQGTSMASPHVAGALALLAAVQPDWTPAEAQSALMLTANQTTLKDDGVTPSDFFDMGAGYANVTAAASTGLIMDESFANYMKADPNVNGMPSQINLATMANSKCVDACTWTRTVKATKDGSWTASTMSIDEGLALTVSPATFDITAGATQELTITADVTEAAAGWNFGNVVLTADGMPEVKMPVATKANGDNLPDSLTVSAQRDTGSVTYTGFKSKMLVDAKAAVYDKTSDLIEPVTLSVPEDGFDYIALTFDEVVPNIVFSTSSATAPDVDLRILDATFARIGRSAGASSDESVSFTNLPAGTYYIVVDGYQASTPGGTDEVLLKVSSIVADEASLSESVNATVTDNNGELSITVTWEDGASIAGILEVSSGDDSYSTQLPISVVRGQDDVVMSTSVGGTMTPGVKNAVSFNIAPNFTNEDKVYTISAALNGHEAADITNGGTVSGDMVTWTITRAAGESTEALPVSFNLIPRTSGSNYELVLTNTYGDDTVTSTHSFDVPEVAPVAMTDAPANVQEGSSITIDGGVSYDANGDDLTYTWTQLSGSPVSFSANAASISFTAPKVSKLNETLSFNLMVEDSNGNKDSTFASIEVVNKKSSGGSFGWLLLAAPLVWLRRRIAK
jgi:subtilisin family serine protease